MARGWWLILAALLGTAVWLATAVPRLQINAHTDSFLEEDDVGIARYYETRQEWGTDEYAIMCVTADDWFTEAGIGRLKAIEADLRKVPFVTSTLSVLDIPLLRQNPEQRPNLLFLMQSIRYLRSEGVDLTAAEAELRAHELAVGNLVSQDGKSLNVLAYLNVRPIDGGYEKSINERRREMVDGVRQVAETWSARLDEPVRLSGIPLINITLFDYIRHDLIVFGIASLLLFTLAFAIVYRRARFVVVPILCCLLPSVGMVGAMSLMGTPVAIVTSNMPVLLFVLLLPYNVYFIERYRERRAEQPEETNLATTLHALRKIAVPCLFSCATTLAGFAALSTSKIIPIRDFGELMTAGLVVGFFVVFLFIPAAFARLPEISLPRRPSDDERGRRGIVRSLEAATLARPAWILAISLVILAVSIAGAFRISAETKFTSYFWPGSAAYKGLEFIDRKMGGTVWLEILLTADEPGFFSGEEGLRALEVAEAYFDEVPETGNILSLTTVRDEMRKTFRQEWFPELTDQAILTMINLAARDLLGQVTNRDFTTGRSTIRFQETAPTLHRNRILAGLKRHLAEHDEVFKNIDVELTGVFPVYARMLQKLLEGLRQSIMVVPLAVYLMLLLLFRSPVLALLVLLPQALPAAVLLGVMGWAGIPLDLVTVMIAAIAIGVGIDAAIQYAMRFRAELDATGDRHAALHRAHGTVGRAIWIATSIIVAGFGILVLSEFFPSVWFGLFTALAMLISQLATLTTLPALFLLTGYPRIRRQA